MTQNKQRDTSQVPRFECCCQDVRRSGALCPLGSAQEQEPAEHRGADAHGTELLRLQHRFKLDIIEELAGDPVHAEAEREEKRDEDQKLDHLAARNVHVFHSKNSFFHIYFLFGGVAPCCAFIIAQRV